MNACGGIGLEVDGSTVVAWYFIAASFGPLQGMGFCVSEADLALVYLLGA